MRSVLRFGLNDEMEIAITTEDLPPSGREYYLNTPVQIAETRPDYYCSILLPFSQFAQLVALLEIHLAAGKP